MLAPNPRRETGGVKACRVADATTAEGGCLDPSSLPVTEVALIALELPSGAVGLIAGAEALWWDRPAVRCSGARVATVSSLRRPSQLSTSSRHPTRTSPRGGVGSFTRT